MESSEDFETVSELLESLKYEINLTDDEKQSFLQRYLPPARENYEGIYDINEELIEESQIESVCYDESIEYESSYTSSSSTSSSESSVSETSYLSFDIDDRAQELIDFSEWARFSLKNGFWESDQYDENRPRRYSELILNEREKSGILTRKIMATSLSHLAQIPGTTGYVLTKLLLQSKELSDITILVYYKNLMYIDLSDNKIDDMRIFCNMPYLIYLNLKNNQIPEMDIKLMKPWFLSHLDLSYNNIEKIPDLASLWSLTTLNLSNNKIITISGLWSLSYLEHLDLSNNLIQIFDVRLFSLNLKSTDLSYNQLSEWSEELDDLIVSQTHQKLNLAHNQLTTLTKLEVVYWLDQLDISFNLIADIKELKCLKNMKILTSLNIDGNEVWNLTDSRGMLIHLIPSLACINYQPISSIERFHAAELFNNTLVQKAFKMFSLILAKRHSVSTHYLGVDRNQRVYDSNIVIFVGPRGSDKWKLIYHLCSKYPNFLRMGRLVTTRKVISSSHMDSISEEELSSLIQNGKIVAIESWFGASYALRWDEIRKDGKLLLIGMDLSTALCLMWQGLAPTLILTITADKDLHIERLKQFFVFDIQERTMSLDEQYHAFSDYFFKLMEEDLTSDEGMTVNASTTSDDFNENQKIDNNTVTSLDLQKRNSNSTSFEEQNNSTKKSIDTYDLVDLEKIKLKILEDNSNQNISKSEHDEYHIYDEDDEYSNQNSHQKTNEPGEDCMIVLSKMLKRLSHMAHTSKNNSSEEEDDEKREGLSICFSEEESPEEEIKIIKDKEVYDHNFKSFIDSVIKTRDEYIDVHHKMPGLFRNAIATDDEKISEQKLTHILQEIYKDLENSPQQHFDYNAKSDPMYDQFVGTYKEMFLKRLSQGPSLLNIPCEDKEEITEPNKNCYYFTK